MTYYKVVRRVVNCDGEKYFSAIAKGKACVEYSTDSWAEPPDWLKEAGYELCIFGCPEDAHDYFQHEFGDSDKEDHQIWECEAENAREPDVPLSTVASVKDGPPIIPLTIGWPEGTMFASKVRLVKRTY